MKMVSEITFFQGAYITNVVQYTPMETTIYLDVYFRAPAYSIFQKVLLCYGVLWAFWLASHCPAYSSGVSMFSCTTGLGTVGNWLLFLCGTVHCLAKCPTPHRRKIGWPSLIYLGFSLAPPHLLQLSEFRFCMVSPQTAFVSSLIALPCCVTTSCRGSLYTTGQVCLFWNLLCAFNFQVSFSRHISVAGGVFKSPHYCLVSHIKSGFSPTSLRSSRTRVESSNPLNKLVSLS